MKNTNTEIRKYIIHFLTAVLLSIIYAFVAEWIYGEVGTAFNLELPQFSYWFWWVTTWFLSSVFKGED